jgi:Protein of unknown function (DUF1403)
MRFAPSSAEFDFTLRPLPAWARLKDSSLLDLDAGVCAGAGLATLDAILRAEPTFGGAWRSRLALTAAAASVRLVGRREEASDVRDAWFLRRPGDDPGPAGGHLYAWRLLTHTTSSSIEIARRAAQAFGLNPDDLSDILAAIDTASSKGALCAAARDQAPLPASGVTGLLARRSSSRATAALAISVAIARHPDGVPHDEERRTANNRQRLGKTRHRRLRTGSGRGD